MAAKKKPVAKAEAVQHQEAEVAVARVKSLRAPDVLTSLNSLQAGVQEGLSGLAQKIADAVRQYDDLKVAIATGESRLRELYEVEQELLSLADVRADREEFEASLEAEKSERDAERIREDNEFHYNLTRRRKQEADAYADQVAQAKKKEEEGRLTRLAELAQREEKVRAAEEEIKAVRKEIEAVPATIDAAVKKSEAILKAVLTKDFDHKDALLRRDAEAAQALAQQEIGSLLAQNERLEARISELSTQVVAAQQQVKEIASKAVDSASGQQALAALQANAANQVGAGKAGGR